MWRFGSWPVTIRIAVATAALMILLGMIASQQVLSTLGRLQDERLQELARQHVEGLAVALGPFALHRDVWEIYDTLDRAQQNSSGGRILFTVVADEQGRVLAATDPLRAPVDAQIGSFLAEAVPVDNLSAASGHDVVRVTAPLLVQGRTVGQVVSELDVSDLAEQRRNTALVLLASNALATLLLVGTGYLVVTRILRPVALLARHMGEVGGTPHPVPASEIPASDTELSRLLRNFNIMAEAVDARSEAERRLAERERFVSLGRLASSLAHEINNPLGGLLNATDTIRTYADDPFAVRKSAEIVERGLKHMRDVARVTLDQNRLDRSGQPVKPEDFEDIHLLIEPEIRYRSQTLEWKVEAEANTLKELPAAPVRQIVLNLLLNAAAAAPHGGTVGLEVWEEPSELHMCISDNGSGLSSAARQRLLSSGALPPGGGVGLRVVHDLVDELGGRINLKQEMSPTQIEVILPLCARENVTDA